MRYFIQDARQYVGNCVLWWCPDGGGYTTQIDEAGRYSEEKAKEIARNRDTDIPWPEDVVWRSVVQHVRIERLRDNGKPACFSTDDMREVLDSIGQIPTTIMCHPDDVEQLTHTIKVVNREETAKKAKTAPLAAAFAVFDGLKVLADKTGAIPRGAMVVLDQYDKPITQHNNPEPISEEVSDG
jgi:hypothetical protein